MSAFTALRLPASRSLRAGIAFTLPTTVFIALWLQFQWGGNHLTTVMDDITQIVAPFFAAGCCLVAALRTRARRRFAWLMLGASAAVWGLGSGAWAYYEVLRGEAVPYPSLADVGYLSAVPLAAVALVAFFRRGEASVRHLLDGLLVAGGLLAVSWTTVMGALFASHSGGALENALGLAYPIGDVILLTVALSLLRAARGEWRLALVLLCSGILLYSIADSLFTYLTTIGVYSTVNGMDVMWVVAYYLIGIAALVPSGQPDSPFDRRWSTVSVVLPYGFVAIALLVAVAVNLHGGLTMFYVWNVRGLLGVLLIRQAITLRENRQLNRHLEERVAERTRELASRERHFRALIQRSTDSTTVLDSGGVITYQSPAIKPFLGYRASEVVGQPFAMLLQPEDAVRFQSVVSDLTTGQERSASLELQLEHRDGTARVGEATLTNLLGDADVGGVVVNMRDVTMRIRLREELAHNTVHDGLTGLPNRTLFNERLAHALRKNKRMKSATTVMFVDIDHFKAVNDTKGHAVGDAVLVAAATRIESCVRVSDTVARLGGDEFGIILEGVSERARAVARRVVEAMQAPVHTGQGDVIASVSVGVAAAMPTDDVETLVRHADTAMYQAKARGRNQLALYDPATHAHMLDEMQLQSDLRVALPREELRVHFQPVVDLNSGAVVGGEALLRWQHPTRGLIAAGEFIAAAERSGAMRDIGRWVLGESCRLAGPWFRDGGRRSTGSASTSPRCS
ncbi:MAG: diguanylate cyclase [Candidatus Dormibacteraeota bacterium]|nr:diguanylate cyclase [Candidatus Dormibacteraeota bacterium]